MDGYTPECVGVDLGISNIAVTSDGTFYRNDRPYEKSKKTLKKSHRKLSESERGSPEWRERLSRLKHAYSKVTEHRKRIADSISNEIVWNNDVIVMERLSVKGLRHISKDSDMTNMYNDALLGRLRTKITYKAIGAGKEVVLVDPKGTSQRCSKCGKMVKKDLSERTHSCPRCGLVIDRDLNASINILGRGLGKWGGPATPFRPQRKESPRRGGRGTGDDV
jgi:putative transposase